VTTAALVLAVTGLSPALGPALTGVLAPFPIAMSVLAAFVLAQHGPAHVEALLKGFLRGALGFAVFCFLVSILLQPTGTPAAFAIGLLGAVFVQLLSQLARRPSSSTQSA
jgi:hypothetical protein